MVAALLFAGVFGLRLVNDHPGQAVTLFYALPIALLAVEFGLGWGVAAAVLALGLFALWDVAWSASVDGSAFAYLTRGTAFLLLGGLVGVLGDRLRRVSAESARFWELSTDLLGTAGFDGFFGRLNPAWERTLGWTPEELRSQPSWEFVHPDDRARARRDVASLADVGCEPITFENRYRCKDGRYRSVLWGAKAIPGTRSIHVTGRDVTDDRRAQEELRASERFLDSVLENLPSMVVVKDAEELRVVRVNRAGEELMGSPREELIGKNDHDLFSPQDADASVLKDQEVLATGGVVDIPEETIETAQRGSRILHTRKIAIRGERGEPRYLLGISDDITDRKVAERAATAARAEAERANQAKNEFLSRMSHELRTPLNAVIGFGQLLELDDMDPGRSESVDQILKAGRHLLALINEVLDISQIESGSMSMSLEPVHLGSVLAEALSLIRPLADEADVRLVSVPSECEDVHVLADQQRLKQVVINLLSNAVKYNRRGGEVSVRCAAVGDGRMEVAVADTGQGMSAGQLERLFEPFERLGAERSDIEGTGLGLSLSRGLMEAMAGAITAESEPGVGSVMRIQLHAVRLPEETEAAHDVVPVILTRPLREARTIVYMEDNLSSLKLVERLLDRLPDIWLIPAMHGKLGLDLVRQHRPDLILLDLHLPDMHGRDVLAQLKDDPTTAAIPVVVLSADATPAQFERLRAAGAAGYLTKPIEVESLLTAVQSNIPAPLAR